MNKFIIFALLKLLCLFFLNPAKSQVQLDSSHLPIIIINTKGIAISDEPKIPATMGIINNGPDNLNYITDQYNDYNGNIGIELRGSSSQMFDKKSFGIETWNENLADTSVSILGMPEEEDWVLYGPYSDKSLLRNVLAFKLGRDLGRYASETRLCELILNNQYWGVYVFMEKIKRDKNRVDISKLNPDENSGDDLTGGYIIKLDKMEGGNSGDGWTSRYRPPNYTNPDQVIYFQYDYPKNDEITEQQRSYISQYVNTFEEALRSEPLGDLIDGYRAYIDISSFIDYAIISELSRNIDAYRLSTFLYKDKNSVDGRLYLGPIWDFNLGFGNANYCDGSRIDGWAWDFNYVCNEDYWLIPFWWIRMLSDQYFTSQLAERWYTLREGPYRTDRILNYIDSMAVVLSDAKDRNFKRWPVLGTYLWPNEFVGNSYNQEIGYLKDWISGRLDWIDNNIERLVTSIEPDITESPAFIYPNPFSNEIKIELKNKTNEPAVVEIHNLSGEIIYNCDTKLYNSITWNGRTREGTVLPPGMYILSLKLNGKPAITKKIIKR